MSTITRTVSTVICDGTDNGQSCPQDSDSLGLSGGVAAMIRKRLHARGWRVNLPNPQPGNSLRLDLCPSHKGAPREGWS